MRTILVSHKQADLPLQIPGIDVVPARVYLTDPAWTKERALRVINLCRSYRYQSEGYYVSLLAAARRHRPFPDLRTVLDMKSRHFARTVDEELDAVIQKSLHDIEAAEFELSVYFGKNLAQRHTRLAHRLFSQFPTPLQRAHFRRDKKRWRMTSVSPIAFRDVPEAHREFVATAARDYLGRASAPVRARRTAFYDLAILCDPNEDPAPSDPVALGRFERAARAAGFDVERIQRDDFARLPEFDALLIRETTSVDHHTFRFAQRAEAEGMVVIDDPTSILRCTNKVFQTEALTQRGVPIPKTWISDRIDIDHVEQSLGFPCVLKFPDSSFSQGVVKCKDRAELETQAARILAESDLLVVQEYMPTDFDWRIGLFDGEPLYACRYLMANGHWQVIQRTNAGSFRYGRVEPVPLSEAPANVVKIATRAAAAIGEGLYGVDVKVAGKRVVVTEVNDNPNIDAGCEDAILKGELYDKIIRGFVRRLEALRGDSR